MWRLHNSIQPYAWGSREAIARLQGRAVPSESPEAELWMGAHARAPSRLGDADGRSLRAAIEADPSGLLGDGCHREFGPRLPYLLKVLAAAQPLSLQAHPDQARARAGFSREDAAGVPRDARHRNYRDPHAKPELVCALDPFVALCGFREVEKTRALVESLGVPALRQRAEPLWSLDPGAAVAAVVRDLLTDPEPGSLVDAVIEAARTPGPFEAERGWIARLGEYYPGDPGVVVAMLLNLVHLAPGEALFLSAGQLHCYLQGTAVEIMGSSDNVLRGGLTPKHVDVPELLEVLDRTVGPVAVVRPRAVSEREAVYDTPTPAFSLSRVQLGAGQGWSATPRGPEVLLCVDGQAEAERGAEPALGLRPGHSAFVPGSTEGYRVRADVAATLFRATVGASTAS